MAKSRRNRARAHGSDPIARKAKTPKPPSDPQLVALREQHILPVLQDLRSPEPKLRTAAAGAIANIIDDEQCRKLLLREQVVHVVLTQTLTDSSLESKAAGWEILKVLVQNEESDFCVHLFRSDILSAIEFAIIAVCTHLYGQSAWQLAGSQRMSVDSRNYLSITATFRQAHKRPAAFSVGHDWVDRRAPGCFGRSER